MAVPLPWAGLGVLGEPAGDCLGLAQIKKKLNKELILPSSAYVWCQIREECLSRI